MDQVQDDPRWEAFVTAMLAIGGVRPQRGAA
jgi:hypothetical protein